MSLRETIAIRWTSGKKAIIARDDYDPAQHTLWEDDHAVQGKAEEVPQEVAAPVVKRKGRPRRG